MSNCCHHQEQALERARQAAENLLSAHKKEQDLPRCEEPMKRYIHPIPCCCPTWPTGNEAALDSILEALARQNQLLLDLLGAVNGLNAAVLSIQSRI